jgi:hypothetical protein
VTKKVAGKSRGEADHRHSLHFDSLSSQPRQLREVSQEQGTGLHQDVACTALACSAFVGGRTYCVMLYSVCTYMNPAPSCFCFGLWVSAVLLCVHVGAMTWSGDPHVEPLFEFEVKFYVSRLNAKIPYVIMT